MKNDELKKKELSLSEKYKVITEVESGAKTSKVKPKNMAFLEVQYQHGCYLKIKKKLKVLFNMVRLTQKGQIQSHKIRIWRNRYLTGLKECE